MYQDFKPASGFENNPAILEWTKEANFWATLYLSFGSHSAVDMIREFDKLQLIKQSAEDVHKRNLQMLQKLMDSGFTKEEIVQKFQKNDEAIVMGYINEFQGV